jgi:predicted RNA-binding protein YlxR (DUF448 family)
LGCGAQDDRGQLIRLSAGAHGELMADDSRAGRGGYLHLTRVCWEKFLRRKSVYRAFHRDIGKSEKEQMVQQLKERHGE